VKEYLPPRYKGRIEGLQNGNEKAID